MSLLLAAVEKPREIAIELLRHQRGRFIEDLFEKALNENKLSAPDRRLCQQLVYGMVRWQKTLDWLIARKTQGRTQKDTLQHLLRLGLFQLFWLDRIPAHAAVNETVDLAKRLGFGPQAGFVNAILRGYLRERDATEKSLLQLRTENPAVGWSHPEWLVEKWRQRFSAAELQRLLEWNNAPAKTFARVNSLKTNAEKLQAIWKGEGVEFSNAASSLPPANVDWIDDNLVFELSSYSSLAHLHSFQDGLFYVQDPSTLLAVRELDPQAGETILDLCAAPGGKTTFIAQLMDNRGKILAHDTSAERLPRLRENCARLGATAVEIISGPDLNAAPKKLFDKILVDAPCSNTGVLRRRVDLRWRIQPAEMARLSKMQPELLRVAALHLKPGGVLVYSTCSLELEENSGVIKKFLAQQPAFKLQNERELLPFRDGVDGAYVAALRHS